MKQYVPEICQDCRGRRRTLNYDCFCVPRNHAVFQNPGDCELKKTTDVQEQG